MGEGEAAASFEHVRFLRENVEVEPEAIPGEEGVALGDLGFVVVDEGGGFVPVHAVVRVRTVAAVEGRLVGVGGESGGTGDAEGALGVPVGGVAQ